MSLPSLTSSSGFLSMLDDPEAALQQYALEQINEVVDRFWPEIATQIPKMSEPRRMMREGSVCMRPARAADTISLIPGSSCCSSRLLLLVVCCFAVAQ